MPIFVKKRPFPQTHSSLMSFFLICHAKPPAISPIYMVKKSKICQNYTILWAQKVNKIPFIPIFHNFIACTCFNQKIN